ncbi:hypothetical protein [Mucilaginibacter antarcticus]|uniref:Uncharacterized protein n=1 Tax=Mucilaginibacter antarcticus TaxID=1855725 RepID=A0ABW5XIZ9_9SPHI
METHRLKLYAIYKDGSHVGNTRAVSKNQAIKEYIHDSKYLPEVYYNKVFMKRYDAVIAKDLVHF